ncbi:hypothetical protein HY572_06070 [Candidatus Micrarchaeota archaeon]|nr:hypothetical protein [Candidatus Micrarchaeota archaeon]
MNLTLEMQKALSETHLDEYGYTAAQVLYDLEKLSDRETHVDGSNANDALHASRCLRRMAADPRTAARFAELLSKAFTDDDEPHAKTWVVLEAARRFEGQGKKGL